MKKIVLTAAALGLFGTCAFADGAAIYQACAQCHGAQGEKAALGGKSKIINTMTKDEIFTSLQSYKAGGYGGKTKALMEKSVSTLDEAQMREVADFIGK